MKLTFRPTSLHPISQFKLIALMTAAGASLAPTARSSTTCSANVTFTGTGAGNAQTIDIFQSGNCDNDAIGLFAGTNVSTSSDAVGSSGPQTVTGSNGNT